MMYPEPAEGSVASLTVRLCEKHGMSSHSLTVRDHFYNNLEVYLQFN